jgi:hypothetical protein
MFLTFDTLYLDLMPSTLLCLKIIPSSLVRRFPEFSYCLDVPVVVVWVLTLCPVLFFARR